MKQFILFAGGMALIYLLASVAFGDEAVITAKLKATTLHIAVGSGSIVEGPSGQKYLLTNQHVCNVGSWLGFMRGNYEDGGLIQGKITRGSWKVDLCATRVPKETLGLKIAERLSHKEQLYTRGYPYGVLSQTTGQYLGKSEWDYTYGISEVGECPPVSHPLRDGLGHIYGCRVHYVDNVTNMYSRPGSSGSPVVNISGDLVGVMSSWDAETDTGGMVPLEEIQEFMKGL